MITGPIKIWKVFSAAIFINGKITEEFDMSYQSGGQPDMVSLNDYELLYEFGLELDSKLYFKFNSSNIKIWSVFDAARYINGICREQIQKSMTSGEHPLMIDVKDYLDIKEYMNTIENETSNNNS